MAGNVSADLTVAAIPTPAILNVPRYQEHIHDRPLTLVTCVEPAYRQQREKDVKVSDSTGDCILDANWPSVSWLRMINNL